MLSDAVVLGSRGVELVRIRAVCKENGYWCFLSSSFIIANYICTKAKAAHLKARFILEDFDFLASILVSGNSNGSCGERTLVLRSIVFV